MPLFRICGATLMPLGSELMTCFRLLRHPGTSKSARRPPGLICSAAGCLGACLGSWSANPGRHLPVCPNDLHDLAWRAADELGVCVLWAGQDGSASGKAQKKDSGARRLRFMNSKCECPPSATCLPVGAKKSNLAFALGCLPPAGGGTRWCSTTLSRS